MKINNKNKKNLNMILLNKNNLFLSDKVKKKISQLMFNQ